jgi:hypothetical protein
MWLLGPRIQNVDKMTEIMIFWPISSNRCIYGQNDALKNVLNEILAYKYL